MNDFRVELFTPREKRAAAVFAVAVVLLAASAIWMVGAGGHGAAPGAATVRAYRFAGFTVVSGTEAYALTGVSESPSDRLDSLTRISAYRTFDGARSWQRVPMPAGAQGMPLRLQVVGSGVVLLTAGDPIGANPSSYWLSSNGGADWRRLPVPAHAWGGYVNALDPRTAYLVSHPYGAGGLSSAMEIYWTFDGGAGWQRTLGLDAVNATAGDLRLDSPYTGPVFSNRSDGWMMSGSFVPRPGGLRPVLLRTRDGGASWREVTLPAPPDKSFTLDVPVFPDQGAHGYLALGGAAGLLVYETQDGGQTWAPPYQAGVPWFSAAPDRWVFGEGRILQTSLDWGRTWRSQAVRLPGVGLTLGELQPAGSVLWSFPSGGGLGAVLRSTDGGASWLRMPWPGA